MFDNEVEFEVIMVGSTRIVESYRNGISALAEVERVLHRVKATGIFAIPK